MPGQVITNIIRLKKFKKSNSNTIYTNVANSVSPTITALFQNIEVIESDEIIETTPNDIPNNTPFEEQSSSAKSRTNSFTDFGMLSRQDKLLYDDSEIILPTTPLSQSNSLIFEAEEISVITCDESDFLHNTDTSATSEIIEMDNIPTINNSETSLSELSSDLSCDSSLCKEMTKFSDLNSWIVEKYAEILVLKPFNFKFKDLEMERHSSVNSLAESFEQYDISDAIMNESLKDSDSISTESGHFNKASGPSVFELSSWKLLKGQLNNIGKNQNDFFKSDDCEFEGDNVKNKSLITYAIGYYKLINQEMPDSINTFADNIRNFFTRKEEAIDSIHENPNSVIIMDQLNRSVLKNKRVANKISKEHLEKTLLELWNLETSIGIDKEFMRKVFVIENGTTKKIRAKLSRSELCGLDYVKKKTLRNRCVLKLKKWDNMRKYKIETITFRTFSINQIMAENLYQQLGVKKPIGMADFYELRKDKILLIFVKALGMVLKRYLPTLKKDFIQFLQSPRLNDMYLELREEYKQLLSEFLPKVELNHFISLIITKVDKCLNSFVQVNHPITEGYLINDIYHSCGSYIRIKSFECRNVVPPKCKPTEKHAIGMKALKKYRKLMIKSIRPWNKMNQLDLIDGQEMEPLYLSTDQRISDEYCNTGYDNDICLNFTKALATKNNLANGIRYLFDGEFIINPERSIYSACYKADICKKSNNYLALEKYEGLLYSVSIDECDKTIIERNSHTLFRPIYINGVEAGFAMVSKKGDMLCVRGITVALNYFISRGHQAQALLPSVYKHHSNKCDNYNELLSLYEMNLIEFTQGYGANKYVEVNCQLLQRAVEFGGCIVARSQMHLIVNERSAFSKVVEERLLMPTFCDEDIFFPQDGPLGRLGESFTNTVLCRKYENDWDRVRLQQMQFRDQKIWLFAIAYLLNSDKWFRQAEFLEGYYAKPLLLPFPKVSQYVINNATFYHPHPPETCTRANRGFRLIRIKKKFLYDYRLVHNRPPPKEDLVVEEAKEESDISITTYGIYLEKLFKQKVPEKIPSYIYEDLKALRLLPTIKEPAFYVDHNIVSSNYTQMDDTNDTKIMETTFDNKKLFALAFNWSKEDEFRHLLA
uniref:RNase_Zc3h12a domain-containing protein n=1 Tax=Rhabditophanes sp. KR3021 TaxID=114890 RepID=A0AC35UH40_9BILA